MRRPFSHLDFESDAPNSFPTPQMDYACIRRLRGRCGPLTSRSFSSAVKKCLEKSKGRVVANRGNPMIKQSLGGRSAPVRAAAV